MKNGGESASVRYLRYAAIIAVAILLISVIFIPLFNLNGRSFDVSDRMVLKVPTSSMDGEPQDYPIPTIPKDSIIMVHKLGQSDLDSLRVGDIICFHYQDMLVIHRVVEINKGGHYFVTHGDNNSPDNMEYVPYSDVVGKVIGVSPFLGTVTGILGNITIFSVIVVIIFIIAILSLIEIIQVIRSESHHDTPKNVMERRGTHGNKREAVSFLRTSDRKNSFKKQRRAEFGRAFSGVVGMTSAVFMLILGYMSWSMTSLPLESVGPVDIIDAGSAPELFMQIAFGFGGFLLFIFGVSMMFTRADNFGILAGLLYSATAALIIIADFVVIDEVDDALMWNIAFGVGVFASMVYFLFVLNHGHTNAAGLMFISIFAFTGGAIGGGLAMGIGLFSSMISCIVIASVCECEGLI